MLKKIFLFVLFLFILAPTVAHAATCTDPSNFNLTAPSGNIEANSSLTFNFIPDSSFPWAASDDPLYLHIYLQEQGANSSLYQTFQIWPPFTEFTLGTGIPTDGTYNAIITDGSNINTSNICSNFSNSFTIINGEPPPIKCAGLGDPCCLGDPLDCTPAEGHELNKCCTLCYPETTYCDLTDAGPTGNWKGTVKTLEDTTCGAIDTSCCPNGNPCDYELIPEINALGECICVMPDYGGGGGGDGGVAECDANGVRGVDSAIGCIPIENLNAFVTFFLTWGIGILGGIAIFMIIYGSYQIASSKGDPEKAQAGRELITAAIASLVFLLFSVWFIRVIGDDILNLADFS